MKKSIIPLLLLLLLLLPFMMISIADIMTPRPNLISPPHDGEITTCGAYKFDWTAKPADMELRHYHIVIDTDLDFSGDVFWRSYPEKSSDETVNTGNMQDNKRYYWAVATEARLWPWQNFEWSSFTVDSFKTNFPGLEPISPALNAEHVSQLPEFKWSEHCNILETSWRFILDDDDDFSSLEIDQTGSLLMNDGCVFGYLPPLAPGTMYYWKAKGWSTISDGSTGWTNTGVFTTDDSDPWPPTLSAPANDSEITGDKTTLSWKPILGVKNYHIQIDDEESFIDPVYDHSDTSTSFDATDLIEGMDYYWRVRINYETCGYSRWSDTLHFSIQCPCPAAPVLSEPANDATDVPLDLAYLKWDGVDRADLYYLEVDDSSDFSSIEFAANTDECFDQCTELDPHKKYYWRVRAYHQVCGYGDWSTVWSFTTGKATGIKNLDDQQLPRSFSLLQNYPNPFNMSTTIRFELPQPDFVLVEVYNTLGKKIRTLANENLSAGSWTVNWDGTNENGCAVPSGTYIYRLCTHNYSSSRKMMVIK